MGDATTSVLLASRNAPGSGGGVSEVVSRLLESIDAAGLATCLYSEPAADTPAGTRIPLEHLRTWKRIPVPSSLLRCAVSTARLARALARIRPQIVNYHYADFGGLYFLFLRRFFGYRLIVSAHGSDLLRPSSRLHRWSTRRLLAGADRIICVSNHVLDAARAFLRRADDRLILVPNGVDLPFWKPRENSNRASTTPTIVAVGALRYVKGHDVLVRAMSEVTANHPHVTVRILGEGPVRPMLRTLAEQEGVQGRIELEGLQPPTRVRDALHGATLAVLPSRSEGLPLAVLEAMAAGAPVVATKVGGVPELIRDRVSGLLVEPDDVSGLAAAISLLLGDAQLRSMLAENGRRTAASYSWERTIEQYRQIFQQSAGPEGPGKEGTT